MSGRAERLHDPEGAQLERAVQRSNCPSGAQLERAVERSNCPSREPQ